MSETTYQIPNSVIEDTHAYRGEVEKFLSGHTSPVAFRAIRVPMGIYEQRKNDTFMLRVRGAAGVFLPDQARRIADLSAKFGSGIVHVTTRQDLQLHDVLIADSPEIMESLLEVGLSSRGGGGNTVRNVSACAFSGVCADEVFDVTPYALALTEYLIRDRANFNLPRKFKVAFSGCGKDCSLCSVADLGFFAHQKEGAKGFSVYAGGGMGAHSSLSVLIEEFIPSESIFEVAEAVKRLFDKRGDRANKHRARLRYVLEDAGEDEFRRLYRDELEQVKREGLSFPVIRSEKDQPGPVTASSPESADDDPGYQAWKAKNVFQQKQAGLFSALITLPLGDIEASALREVARLAEVAGDGYLRTAQEQDLYLRGLSESGLRAVYMRLSEINPDLASVPAVRTVACAGASTCKLGLCLSRGLAEALESALSGVDLPTNDPIRISGCPNSCGQHPIAPIGLFGTARRVNGKLVPYYTIAAGGRVAEGAASLAEPIATVPARAIPELLREFFAAANQERRDGESLADLMDRWGAGHLRELQRKYDAVPAYNEAPEFYRDFGSAEDFSLAGRGPGECGAGVLDVVALDIASAGKALEDGDLYAAVSATARALLTTRGLEPKSERESFAAFSEYLIAPGWVDSGARRILDAALDFRLGSRETLDDLEPEIRVLTTRVQSLFKSLDSNLNFRIEPIVALTDEQLEEAKDQPVELDLRGVACPMNFVRAKIHLEQMDMDSILDVLLDDGEPARNVPASFADQGEEVVSVNREGQHFRVRIRKCG
jgi:sulfite reductase (ferredoxin)